MDHLVGDDLWVRVGAAIQTASMQQAIGVPPLLSISHSIMAIVATPVSLLLATIQYTYFINDDVWNVIQVTL
jgi:hypothetical protein